MLLNEINEELSKLENNVTWNDMVINFIKKYNLKPEEVLFIDDKIKHIERVEPTKVNLLHYTNYNIDISEVIFKK